MLDGHDEASHYMQQREGVSALHDLQTIYSFK